MFQAGRSQCCLVPHEAGWRGLAGQYRAGYVDKGVHAAAAGVRQATHMAAVVGRAQLGLGGGVWAGVAAARAAAAVARAAVAAAKGWALAAVDWALAAAGWASAGVARVWQAAQLDAGQRGRWDRWLVASCRVAAGMAHQKGLAHPRPQVATTPEVRPGMARWRSGPACSSVCPCRTGPAFW